ncbi:ARM repeat-containing protein [Mytilinidion resinicola]|uniref:ARM repeat-containing protein n=1 Tax=Mytilinidion resinicola TaxID=574789 RepID=A0A6A6Y697_9PEZI|nr:ARM repeat-containing protein [Mytilinidion resinicola]KAF2804043.1 ARM repeat-containing protein [Mytilinidion resinicola]
MATRSRRSAATEVMEEEEEEGGLVKLRFNDSLVGRPGKPISVGDLLRRLQELSQELRGMEQEEAERDSLLSVAKELAHHNLLLHKDGGIFPALADPSNAYNAQHLYVLKSLAEVKSIVLLTDIPSSNTLALHLFTICFDVLSGPSKADSGEELSKNVEHHMTALLGALVEESQGLPPEVVDVILAQFLRADPRVMTSTGTKGKKHVPIDEKQMTLLLKEAPPAYNMAKNVCNSCPDKMARLVGHYFSSVIVDASTAISSMPKVRSRKRASSDLDDSEDEGPTAPSEEDLKEAKKAHNLLRELWRCSPDVLQDIIPNLQEELSAENLQLRLLATETFGDMIAGIGAAGPPPSPVLDPAAFPSQSLASASDTFRAYNFLTTPTSPHSFPSQYTQPYQAFLQRKQDKSPVIRAAWATSIGRILMTSAGGAGLDQEEEQKLLRYFSQSLIDSDERVRVAAINAIDQFPFQDIVEKLGSNGIMSEPGSILSNLADRVKDKKPNVRTDSMKLIGKIWGVAAGAMLEGNERVSALLQPVPSKILETCYINDKEINVLVDHVLYEYLLPLAFPPIKAKAATNGNSQAVKDSQKSGYTEAEIDKIRTERQLLLVKGLDERAKKVYFAKQGNQAAGVKFMETFLGKCEEYNGGVMDGNEKEIKQQLNGLISYYSGTFADSQRAQDDLWKFVKAHDRRNYQLIRFCMAPDSDYRKVHKSIKELRKRIEDAPGSSTLLETLQALLYRVSILAYNRSHVPAIIQYSRTNEHGFASAAHEILKEISTKHPDVFKAHVQELCKVLESGAPTAKKPNGLNAVDDLKACSGFAQKFPAELPKDRKFVQSMISFALYGSPPKAAKHAVTILMSSADKKEMHAKDLISKCTKGFEYGSGHYLTRLAALSQLMLLGPKDEEDVDEVTDIAITNVLQRESPKATPGEPDWMDVPDDDLTAKIWALKILVNRLRSISADAPIAEAATTVYKFLMKLVTKEGELSETGDSSAPHKARLRLVAAQFLLKLSCTRRLDNLLNPTSFYSLATVAQDPHTPVRTGFINKLMKYLGQSRLSSRFFSIIFLLAYEPEVSLKESAITFVRSQRARMAARKETTLEQVFARLISLLAHHPDFDTDAESLQDSVQYILLYLKCVATSENLSLIYHVAQRVKSVADGISNNVEADKKLYMLSDLAQAVIRLWEELNGWNMQAWPGKLKLPAGIFKALESHERAQEIANKIWVDEEATDGLDAIVRNSLRGKKRKSLADHNANFKKKLKMPAKPKPKPKTPKSVRTPKKKSRRNDDSDLEGDAEPSSEITRRSVRKSTTKSYVELSDDEDEEQEKQWQNVEEEEQESAENTDAEGAKEDNGHTNDVNMDDADAEPGAEVPGSEDELYADPKPIEKKQTRTRGGKKSNGVSLPSRSKQPSSPTVNGKAKQKPKANGKALAEKPNGRATRATAKTVVPASDDEDISD